MKTVNNFQISGFVVNNATINQFATATIARFGLSVRRTEKNGDEEKKVSAILNIEAWKSNEAADAFNLLTKGKRITVEGYFKPEEWTDKDNVAFFLFCQALSADRVFLCHIHYCLLVRTVPGSFFLITTSLLFSILPPWIVYLSPTCSHPISLSILHRVLEKHTCSAKRASLFSRSVMPFSNQADTDTPTESLLLVCHTFLYL